MPAKCGRAVAIAAYVAAHPGCLRADLLAAFGLDKHDAMPTYCTRIGTIFPAGPRCSQRYYPTRELADAADAELRAEAKLRRKLVAQEHHRRQNLKRRAKRAASGKRVLNTRPGACVPLSEGTQFADDVRLVLSRPVRGRFESLAAPSVINAAEARPWAQAYTQRGAA